MATGLLIREDGEEYDIGNRIRAGDEYTEGIFGILLEWESDLDPGVLYYYKTMGVYDGIIYMVPGLS